LCHTVTTKKVELVSSAGILLGFDISTFVGACHVRRTSAMRGGRLEDLPEELVSYDIDILVPCSVASSKLT
jgi:hypothetical protein